MTHSVFTIKVYRAPFVVLHGDNISTSISMYMLNELLHTMKLSIKSLHHNANDMEVRIIYIAYTLLQCYVLGYRKMMTRITYFAVIVVAKIVCLTE